MKTLFIVRPQIKTLVVTNSSPVNLLVQFRGVQGAKGGTGEQGGVYEITATQPILGHRAVWFNGAIPLYADDQLPIKYVAGITTNAASIGGLVSIRYAGEMSEIGWNFEPNKPVFVTTDGQLTQAQPSPVINEIGWATNATTLLLNIQPPIEDI